MVYRGRSQWWLGVAVVSGLIVCMGASAQGPLEKASKEAKAAEIEPVVIRMYNVQDLTLGRDYPYRSAVVPPTALEPYGGLGSFGSEVGASGELFGGGETTVGEPESLSSALTPDVVAELIQRTVDPASWEERASIERVGALLVITQTAENHEKIAELLAEFRKARPMVTVEARWILVDDAKAPLLFPKEGAGRTVPAEVSEELLQQAGVSVIYRGQITSFDRQTVHLATGRGQAVVADMEPIVAEAAVAYEQAITTLLWGALLEVTPVLSPDRKSVTMRLHSLITEEQSLRTKTVVSVTSDKGAKTTMTELDLPEFLLHTFRTAVRAPLDKEIIVGGMTAPKAADGKVLYLVLCVSASE
ncbi:MAG: hypothetical protein WBD63_08825 [Phycisphaerae bacterium]